jgi:diguanylate cyclase (GGDEF)-like protein
VAATALQAESIYVPDVSKDPRYLQIASATRSQLTFPLLADGAVIGVLNTESAQLNGFDEQARRILGNYASNAALAIRNLLLVKETEERAVQLAQLNEITRNAISNYGFKDTLRKIVNDLVHVFEADICFISLWDDQEKMVVRGAASGRYDKTYQSMLPIQHAITLTGTVLEVGKPLIVPDFQTSPIVGPRIAESYPIQCALAMPMIIGRQKLGSLTFAFKKARNFSEAEIKVGEQFANQVGLAISKAWALEVARQRAREAENLRLAASAISSSLELPQVLDNILTHLEQVVLFDSACVFLRESTHLRAVAGRGLPDPTLWLNRQFPLDELYLLAQRSRQPTLIGDASQDGRFHHWGETIYVRGWMGVPLIIRERVTGILTLDSRQPNAFNSNHARQAAAFADQVAIAIENARLYQQVQWEAMNDPLTRLYNRRGLFDLGQREVERSRRFGHPLTAIMIDIDLFKDVNDNYGHNTGDLVLSALADELVRQVRDVDIVGRYGGEEIVILLPETSLDGGVMAAERLRQAVEQLPIPGEQALLTITISLGVAELTSRVTDLTTLIDMSDNAMYQAKQAGRNRVCAYQPSASK